MGHITHLRTFPNKNKIKIGKGHSTTFELTEFPSLLCVKFG